MKKLISCLVALAFVASCAKSVEKAETSSNKYSNTKQEASTSKEKSAKKAKKAKAKKHGGSEVK